MVYHRLLVQGFFPACCFSQKPVWLLLARLFRFPAFAATGSHIKQNMVFSAFVKNAG